MTEQIESGYQEILSGFDAIAENGGYRERVEALEALKELTWFDNFGYVLYQERLRITRKLCESVQESDIPEYFYESEEVEL
jgi:hypothetical protein